MPTPTCPTHDAPLYRDEEVLRCLIGNEIVGTRWNGSFGQSTATSICASVSRSDEE